MALQATSFGQAYKAARANRPPRQQRPPILATLGRLLGRLLPTWAAVRTLVLSLAGFGLLVTAAFTLHVAAGLAASGVCLLVLEYLTSSGGSSR